MQRGCKRFYCTDGMYSRKKRQIKRQESLIQLGMNILHVLGIKAGAALRECVPHLVRLWGERWGNGEERERESEGLV